MAEALWNRLGSGQWQAYSAGSDPTGEVHPLAIAVMKELDIDLSKHRSKPVSEFQDQAFDLVVTVCDGAKDACPYFPGTAERLHWPFEDPASTDDWSLARFRETRDGIQSQIEEYLAADSEKDGHV